MKKLLTIIGLFAALAGHAQTKVKQDAQGNYVLVHRDSLRTSKLMGKYFIDKDGVKHPLLISARGKLYYMRTSRNGNVYKCYIKEA